MPSAPFIGAAGLVLAVPLYLVALTRLRRLDEPDALEHPLWWFGYARDGVNLGGALVFVAAYWIAGLTGPLALTVGLSLLLTSYCLDWALGKHLGWARSAWLLAPLLALFAALSVVELPSLAPVVTQVVRGASPR